MNIPMLLSPKAVTSCVNSNATLRQALEMFKIHGYSAVPVIDDGGMYVGTISEGDFLRHITAVGEYDIKDFESLHVKDIIRRDFNPSVTIDATIEEVVERLTNTNFIPVCDARGCYVGIITRKSLIENYIVKSNGER